MMMANGSGDVLHGLRPSSQDAPSRARTPGSAGSCYLYTQLRLSAIHEQLFIASGPSGQASLSSSSALTSFSLSSEDVQSRQLVFFNSIQGWK